MQNTAPGRREPILETDNDRAVWAWLTQTVGPDRAQEALELIPAQKRSYPGNAVTALGLKIPEQFRKAPKRTVPKADGESHVARTAAPAAKPPLRTPTYDEVATHLRALAVGAPHGFNIGMRNSASGLFAKNWTPKRKEGREEVDGLESRNDALSHEQINAAIPLLGHLNLHGFKRATQPSEEGENKENVYVRAHYGDTNSIVLVDDIQRADYDQMLSDGLVPAILVRTSKQSYQAWFILPKRRDPRLVDDEKLYWPTRFDRQRIAQYLAYQYHGDRAAARGTQYGRLAGFLNVKLKHRTPDGRYVHVSCVPGTDHGQPCDTKIYEIAASWSAEVDARTHDLVKQAAAQLTKTTSLDERTRARPDAGTNRELSTAARSKLSRLARGYEDLASKQGKPTDNSKRDWYLAIVMTRDGWSIDAVANALIQCPELDIQNRKAQHPVHYATLTAAKANWFVYAERQAEREGRQLGHATKLALASQMTEQKERERLDKAIEADRSQGGRGLAPTALMLTTESLAPQPCAKPAQTGSTTSELSETGTRPLRPDHPEDREQTQQRLQWIKEQAAKIGSAVK